MPWGNLSSCHAVRATGHGMMSAREFLSVNPRLLSSEIGLRDRHDHSEKPGFCKGGKRRTPRQIAMTCNDPLKPRFAHRKAKHAATCVAGSLAEGKKKKQLREPTQRIDIWIPTRTASLVSKLEGKIPKKKGRGYGGNIRPFGFICPRGM